MPVASQVQGSKSQITRRVFFHGYTYNATLGSRVQLTETLKNGYVVCYDPESVSDGFAAATANANSGSYAGDPTNTYPTDSTYKAKMKLEGYADDRFSTMVCKPYTAGLALVAGIVTGLPSAGLLGTTNKANGGYVGGVWIDVVIDGPVRAYVKADQDPGTPTTKGFLGAVNAEWHLAALATSTAASNSLVVARALMLQDTSTTAAWCPVMVGGSGIACRGV